MVLFLVCFIVIFWMVITDVGFVTGWLVVECFDLVVLDWVVWLICFVCWCVWCCVVVLVDVWFCLCLVSGGVVGWLNLGFGVWWWCVLLVLMCLVWLVCWIFWFVACVKLFACVVIWVVLLVYLVVYLSFMFACFTYGVALLFRCLLACGWRVEIVLWVTCWLFVLEWVVLLKCFSYDGCFCWFLLLDCWFLLWLCYLLLFSYCLGLVVLWVGGWRDFFDCCLFYLFLLFSNIDLLLFNSSVFYICWFFWFAINFYCWCYSCWFSRYEWYCC